MRRKSTNKTVNANDFFYQTEEPSWEKTKLAANKVFARLNPVQAEKLGDADPLKEIWSNNLPSMIQHLIADYACCTKQRAPKDHAAFRTLRDAHVTLKRKGMLQTEKSMNRVRRVLIKLKNVPAGNEGQYIIPDHCFLPRHPSDVKRLWIITDPDYTVDQPLIHNKNAFLEDKMHDWDHFHVEAFAEVVGIRYYGTGRGAKQLTLLAEFEE